MTQVLWSIALTSVTSHGPFGALILEDSWRQGALQPFKVYGNFQCTVDPNHGEHGAPWFE